MFRLEGPNVRITLISCSSIEIYYSNYTKPHRNKQIPPIRSCTLTTSLSIQICIIFARQSFLVGKKTRTDILLWHVGSGDSEFDGRRRIDRRRFSHDRTSAPRYDRSTRRVFRDFLDAWTFKSHIPAWGDATVVCTKKKKKPSTIPEHITSYFR